jgi:hypothetical protein
MSAYIGFNSNTEYGHKLRVLLNQLEESDEDFSKILGTMAQMLEGDGSQDSHFSTIATNFGFPSETTARAAWNELQSAYSKTSGNGSVSSVRAARDQLFNKMR